MLGLLGIRRNASISTREEFSISLSKLDQVLPKLNSIFEEVVIISTCNRTEIYFVTDLSEETAREHIFEALHWDKSLIEYTFIVKEKKAVDHIMKVACGFHSKILGEDQILGQIKEAFDVAVSLHCVRSDLQNLFQKAIGCGKAFRSRCELYKIPVSAASITVKDSIKRQVKSLMIIGYGNIGKLAVRYALDSKHIEKIYLAIRDLAKHERDNLIVANPKIKTITLSELKEYYTEVQAVISCTSAPHLIIRRSDFEKVELNKAIVIYDLAVPRDVEESIKDLAGIELYNIDNLNSIDEENKNKRREVMLENLHIIEEYVEAYMNWKSIREIVPQIERIKAHSSRVFEERFEVFKNKQHSKNAEELAEKLIKSAAQVYANRAIEVLKEEKLKGREEECLRILERIFFN
ncbi:glutamyl-tRNA reductase [Clostridium thermarum]|uniref:glutamyl-tRNA reductase n=1 Tax=Clostridium thermarum TaxID=1716543 RepID=UPI0013D51652|nr:glutamyl-tRNA reductase [Clostridium thermarum]